MRQTPASNGGDTPTMPTPTDDAGAASGIALPPEWLMLANELGGVGTWALDLGTRRVEFSPTQSRLLGLSGEVTLEDVMTRIDAGDVEDVAVALRRCAEGGEPFDAEFRFQHPERGQIWLGGRASRVEHPETGAPHVVGINFDVTRRRSAEIDAREVSREMAHRMKNVFALISGISRIIARTVPDVPSFASALADRTAALARLSDMTLDRACRGVALRELAQTALTPFDTSRIATEVAELRVNNAAAQTLLLALHELATNALKHGALSVDDGTVDLRLLADEATDGFRLEWTEHSSRQVNPPSHQGFGTQVLTRVTRNTHGGHPVTEWRGDGLHFRCDWDLSRMVA